MDIAVLVNHFRTMLDLGVFVDPLLANTYFRDPSNPVYAAAQSMAQRMYDRYVNIDDFSADLEDIPFSPALMKRGLLEILLSTAISTVYETTGSVVPTEEHVVEAAIAVNRLVEQRGIAALYLVYLVVAGHDVLQPLIYYTTVSESEYLDGIRHHPYPREVLDLCLLFGLERRFFRLKTLGRQRTIQLTRAGVEQFRRVKRVFADSGYTSKRLVLSYVYQFDTVEDWDEMSDVVWPDHKENRRQFVRWANIRLGSRVLEVGCGTGLLTFEGGLYEAVGQAGQLLAIDVSVGMLERAQRKHARFGFPRQVAFQQASVERLPYPDESFDVAIGSAVLHFTDPLKALAEMTRVVRPGGMVAIQQGLHFALDRPFFREWFEPMFDLARNRNAEQPRNYLPRGEQLLQWFHDIGLQRVQTKYFQASWLFDNPEMVVQHIVRGVSFFETELMALPWDYRRTIINELIDRGRDVCRKYPLSDRTLSIPIAMLTGIRPRNEEASA